MAARSVLGAIATLGVVALVSGCGTFGGGENDPRLMNIRSASRSPDEFAILPTKPLQMPQDLAALPEPTPGGRNLVDPTPEADAVAALGGNPALLQRDTIPAASGSLIAHVTRFGVAQDIRATLAAEDLDYRRRNDGRLLERLFDVNVYFRAYAPMTLDPYAELERWRRAGLRTVSAPPRELTQE